MSEEEIIKWLESVRKQFETYQDRICELEEKNKELEKVVIKLSNQNDKIKNHIDIILEILEV